MGNHDIHRQIKQDDHQIDKESLTRRTGPCVIMTYIDFVPLVSPNTWHAFPKKPERVFSNRMNITLQNSLTCKLTCKTQLSQGSPHLVYSACFIQPNVMRCLMYCTEAQTYMYRKKERNVLVLNYIFLQYTIDEHHLNINSFLC